MSALAPAQRFMRWSISSCIASSHARGAIGCSAATLAAAFAAGFAAAFAAACRVFVAFCRGERLIRGELVAIDGSKFQAVASKRKMVSRGKLERQVVALDADIARYLAELEAADAAE